MITRSKSRIGMTSSQSSHNSSRSSSSKLSVAEKSSLKADAQARYARRIAEVERELARAELAAEIAAIDTNDSVLEDGASLTHVDAWFDRVDRSESVEQDTTVTAAAKVHITPASASLPLAPVTALSATAVATHSLSAGTAPLIPEAQLMPPTSAHICAKEHGFPLVNNVGGKVSIPSFSVAADAPCVVRQSPPVVAMSMPSFSVAADAPCVIRQSPPVVAMSMPSFSVAADAPCTIRKSPPVVPTPCSDIQNLANVIATLAKGAPCKVSSLPKFSGKPHEWLNFKRVYDISSPSYSQLENIARLGEALTGEAYDSVSTLLLTADEPEIILCALQRRFARSEQLLAHELSNIRSLPRLTLVEKDLGNFASKVRSCVTTIKLLNQYEYLYSRDLLNSLLFKLTPHLKYKWSDYAATHYTLPSTSPNSLTLLEMLSNFLEEEADRNLMFLPSISLYNQPLPHNSQSTGKPVYRDNKKAIAVHTTDTNKSDDVTCLYCLEPHRLNLCTKFLCLSINDRWIWIREHKVCAKCLKSRSHQWSKCRAKPCGVGDCRQRHHKLLHAPVPPPAPPASAPQPAFYTTASPQQPAADVVATTTAPQQTYSCSSLARSTVLLKIVAVEITGPLGTLQTYALLDEGSTATVIDAEAARQIGASGFKGRIDLDGVGGMRRRDVPIEYVDFDIRGKYCDEVYSVKNARAMESLSIRPQTIRAADVINSAHLVDLVEFVTYEDAKPMVLLGAGDWPLILSKNLRVGTRSQPVASLTALGWVLHGCMSNSSRPVEFLHHAVETDITLDELVRHHYRLDSIGVSNNVKLSSSDERALRILDSTAKRLPSGRFEVGLLWKEENLTIPNSIGLALSRLRSLKKKLAKDSSLSAAYDKNVKAFVDKHYAEKCSSAPSTHRFWYLPHFGVVHPLKPGKVRVVHDAAAKVQGVSLNSMLLTGPDLLQPLIALLFRFREGRVAITADIREFFMQIKIIEEDRDALRFLWHEGGPDSKIVEFRMTSVIFGAVCSPCAAIYIKNKNAQEFCDAYPNAAEAIIKDHYMDNYIGSLDDPAEASKLTAQIIEVHASAGFEIRDWASNSVEALADIPYNLRLPEFATKDMCHNVSIDLRILGLIWNPHDDTFSFKFDFPILINFTKRNVLKSLMRVYDPLGLLCILIVRGRILFQNIWRSGVGWDDTITADDQQSWEKWMLDLKSVSELKIPRWYSTHVEYESCQLHVFCDASEHAYATVAYWRYVFRNGEVKSTLIGSKARVSPLKSTSIPRLELQGALIAARFADTITREHKKKSSRIFFWSDSKTVLCWLRNDARTFKPFVSHRVAEISELSVIDDWRWCPSSMNVADDATRYTSGPLASDHRWFVGPPFLYLHESDWPQEASVTSLYDFPDIKSLELKRKELVSLQIEHQYFLNGVCGDPSRFSKYNRLLRATALAHKFIKILRARARGNRDIVPDLTVDDLQLAERHILRLTQATSFKEEIDQLMNNKPVPPTSKLFNLSPFLDDHGLIRLGSRIGLIRGVDNDAKFPVILDGRNPAVRLLVMRYHEKAAHVNHEMVINELRQRFWILPLRSTVKAVIRLCRTCQLRRAKTSVPPMGDLPAQRLQYGQRPFTCCGLDHFGPFNVTIGRRHEKRYVALFTCLTTRAVHLEVASSLSTDSTIMCVRRFISRRGCPKEILSDNGTSFVSAAKQLGDFATNAGIQWKFIPPSAPSMGGAWERLVRTVKAALSVTLKDSSPKEEVLTTLLLEAENIVNSRPLTYVSSNQEDVESLSPNHFLMGTSSSALSSTSLDDSDLNCRTLWRQAVRLSDHFWRRWLKEYLPTLLPRRQSKDRHKNLEVGELVFIVDGNLPRGVWPRGVITNIFPGRDGIVRVVELRTAGGILRRPVRKVVRLCCTEGGM